jgi:hypothetical protein
MRNLITRNLKGRIIIPLFLFAGIVYTIMMTITIPKVMSFSDGMKILDMMPFGYNAAYVDSLLITLGEKGRYAYLVNQIPLDMIYPLLFGISLCLILAYLLKRLGKSEGSLFYICFLPLISALFDYCENIGVITILNSYPDNSNLLAQTTNVFSVLKSTSTTINFVILIVLLIALWIRKLYEKIKLRE